MEIIIIFISPVGSTSTLYWDVNNNYDLEDNLVKLYPRTGYDTAQTWKVVMQDNGSVVLIPMISLTRGLTFKKFHISVILVIRLLVLRKRLIKKSN